MLYHSSSSPTHSPHSHTDRVRKSHVVCYLLSSTGCRRIIRKCSLHRALTAFCKFWQFLLENKPCWFSFPSCSEWLKQWPTLTEMLPCNLAWWPKLSLPQFPLIRENSHMLMGSHKPTVALVNSVPILLPLRCVSSVHSPFTHKLFTTQVNQRISVPLGWLFNLPCPPAPGSSVVFSFSVPPEFYYLEETLNVTMVGCHLYFFFNQWNENWRELYN